eukprot:TRINITY_DN1292_c0_g1_i1.p1 TRINITY_DN1292_c0_g1~~TRINITY_DN1292_c0_g1_i1.p1  ORF type:complete len:55 (+),score=4.49 TRINITY_DN1292_c0_g1_i1:127-291(+)
MGSMSSEQKKTTMTISSNHYLYQELAAVQVSPCCACVTQQLFALQFGHTPRPCS